MLDYSILNTMTKEIKLACILLNGTKISILDAARLIKNILDAFPENSQLTPMQFCSRIIDAGKLHLKSREISIRDGFSTYLNSKRNLRPESLRDIKYLGGRLLKNRPDFAKLDFSALTLDECETWLSSTFTTPAQFNKGRTMLHALFEFAMRHQWCDRNIVKLVEKRKFVEKEILPLSISDMKLLLRTAQKKKYRDCSAGIGLMLWAGIRPREVCRLEWRDIDFEENAITIRSQCSKTGGIRHVEMCSVLKRWLLRHRDNPETRVCPCNFKRKWKNIRDASGFKGMWVQDVLRHTYASYHAKYFRNLPLLQLNMGHRDMSLLRSRYINMAGMSRSDARAFFN